VSLPTSSNNSPNSNTSVALKQMTDQADLFFVIFLREAGRAQCGKTNEVQRASAQLRACLDKIDELVEERDATTGTV
jgi:hypothetical protein